MTVEAQEMQHHARLLRRERNKWQRHLGILAIARRIHGQRDVPADHPELHAFLISVRQILIDRLAHGAERGVAIRGECGEVLGYGGSCHVGDNYSKASVWCASWRLCAGSASTHANVPALTAIINSKPNRNPPTVAARTNALTPSAAPICRMNCWLVVALPMRATGTLFCTTTVSAGESSPIPAPEMSAATMTQPSPCSNATMKKSSPRICTTIPITLGSRSPIRWTNRPAPKANVLHPMVNAPTTRPTNARLS